MSWVARSSGVGRGQHAVRCGGLGVYVSRLFHPERVAGLARRGRQQLGQTPQRKTHALRIQRDAVPVQLKRIVAAAEPGEAVQGLLPVEGERPGGVDQEPTEVRHRPGFGDPGDGHSGKRGRVHQGPQGLRDIGPGLVRAPVGVPIADCLVRGPRCSAAGVNVSCATRAPETPSGSSSTRGSRPRARQPRVRFSSAQPRPMYCSRRSGSSAPVPRVSSTYTSMVRSETRKSQGWVLCGLAARIAAPTARAGPGQCASSASPRRPARCPV